MQQDKCSAELGPMGSGDPTQRDQGSAHEVLCPKPLSASLLEVRLLSAKWPEGTSKCNAQNFGESCAPACANGL